MPSSGRSAASAASTSSRVRLLERVRIAGAADERAHQHAVVGRAVRPLRRQPRGGQDAGAFDARHDEAGSVQRMRDRGAREGERDRRRGRVADIAAQARELAVRPREGGRRSRTPARRRSTARAASGVAGLRFRRAGGSTRERAADRRVEPQRVRRQRARRARGPSRSSRRAAIGTRRRGDGRGPRPGAKRASRLPCCPLGLDEPRKQRADRQPIDVAGVNAGEQRLGEVRRRPRRRSAGA